MSDRAEMVHDTFLRRLDTGDLPRIRGDAAAAGLDRDALWEIFTAQVQSRHLDRAARMLQARGQGFYTIGSSGHEGMAAVAHALRPTDPAFLHYRDGAFQLGRAAQVPGQDAVRDMALGLAAAAADPISGGRHKVLGSKALCIPPQTSTIASHLPKAVGCAWAIGLARRVPPADPVWAADAIAMCSFGDASLNHSTAQGAINAAGWIGNRGLALPLMLVCEDNGIGISVPTPEGWVAASLSGRAGLRYVSCDGLDPVATRAAARDLSDWIRRHRKPGVLHLRCVRLFGHAGSDVESAYRGTAEIDADEAGDPLLRSAARLVAAGATAPEVRQRYLAIEDSVMQTAEAAATHPRLGDAGAVMASILPPHRDPPRVNGPTPDARAAMLGPADLRALDAPQPMNKLLSLALADLMLAHPEIVVAGEDVGRKGGVYGITKGLQGRFGPLRVMDTLLDEQTILGLSIGMAQSGYLPIPEIQFLAYLHNAEDQLRGEAATLPFFSDGQFDNPMVVRIAGLGYQKGFGGHFHNDNSLAVLRDIPGLVLGVPSDGAEAVGMLREAVRLAREEGRVVVIVEPIALYPMRDLHEDGDGLWLRHYPAPGAGPALGEVGVAGQGRDLAIVAYGNGRYLAERARPVLAEKGVDLRVVDLRWLAPLPETAIREAVQDCACVLVVDECRRSGSVSEALMTTLHEGGVRNMARVTAEDSFIATGPAYAATLPSVEGIVAAALRLTGPADRRD